MTCLPTVFDEIVDDEAAQACSKSQASGALAHAHGKIVFENASGVAHGRLPAQLRIRMPNI